jgi:hypothetical protein
MVARAVAARVTRQVMETRKRVPFRRAVRFERQVTVASRPS